MSAFKDKNTAKWNAYFRYTDWKGIRQQKLKRGFSTKREALDWEREFLQQKTMDMDMTFGAFIEVYSGDMKERLKLNTWLTKEHIIKAKLLPAFGERKISDISPKDIIQWQNEMIAYRDEKGKAYSPTYLKTLHNQLSCIFNHAVRFYELKNNPAVKAGNMGKEKSKEMLYWCGIRVGELLALTADDFDFTKSTVAISKSYQRLKGEDVITVPKTEKSNRVIKMSDFLCEEMQDYLKSLYGCQQGSRIFPISKHYLHHEMDRGCKETGVKRIRIHDIRHSHVSLLIDMGFSAVAIADRVGHESINITYRYAHMFPSKQAEMADRLNFERGEGF